MFYFLTSLRLARFITEEWDNGINIAYLEFKTSDVLIAA